MTAPSFEPVRRKRNQFIRTGFLLVGLGFTLACLLNENVTTTMSSQLADPSILRGASMTGGTSLGFWWNGDAVEFRITKAAMAKLLRAHHVFNDCGDADRECDQPLWDHNVGYDIGGPATPDNAACASSSKRPAGDEMDVHVLCVDAKTDAIYFLDWSLGER